MRRAIQIEVTAALITETCCQPQCGILFAVPKEWHERRRRTHDSFWCPNGHGQSYVGETEEQKLRKQLAQAEEENVQAWQRVDQLQNDNMDLARSRAAARGQVTKLRKKIAAGECPAGCHKWFKDLEQHIAAEHPGFEAEAVE